MCSNFNFDSFKANYQQIMSSLCIVNGNIMNINEIEKLGYSKFKEYYMNKIPLKLYKYFPNKYNGDINYSLEALKNNTVYLQDPHNFDDVYDSTLNIDLIEYEKFRLIEYCKLCNIITNKNQKIEEIGNLFIVHLCNSFNDKKNFDYIFCKSDLSEMEKMSCKLFSTRLSNIYLDKLCNKKKFNIAEAVREVIHKEYIERMDRLKNIFRISCFTTTPYSQLMWGSSYADCHRGFCIEYTVNYDLNLYNDIILNLFPVIYHKNRSNITERIAKQEQKEITIEYLWDISFHGFLRKSIDWAYQNEWRLALPNNFYKNNNFNVKFFPITKIFLGNRMPKENQDEIIKICEEKNIEYSRIKMAQNIFEMEEYKI